MERLKTGIPGMDDLVQGGVPKGSVVLVSGSPGTGKTILALQFLVEGTKEGQKVLYVSFEENKYHVVEQARQFGWDLEALEKKGLLKIMCFNMAEANILNVLSEMSAAASQLKPDRVAIDSISVLLVYLEIVSIINLVSKTGIKMETGSNLVSPEAATRASVLEFVGTVRGWGSTTMLTAELPDQNFGYLSRDTISSFVCDGVIKLSWVEGLSKRKITVMKMRSTDTDLNSKEFVIDTKGISIVKK